MSGVPRKIRSTWCWKHRSEVAVAARGDIEIGPGSQAAALEESMMTKMSSVRCVPAPRTVQRGSFDLPLEAAAAFELFTAEGERRWVEGWNPTVLSACGETEAGCVFLTDHGGEHTIWTVIEADRNAGKLLYSRVAPGRRAGTVGVEISPIPDGSRVSVTYDLTALGTGGEAAVLAMNGEGYAAMLAEWRRLILAIMPELG